ncbi:DUF6378 domain-containing protein [Mesorhizobium sp.]|uniref:DUF6378 domain-containing protein n=1 Tax=Mesorhizobium sp. TaxID=1871066 RepID=UPI0012135E84|nr:DUF6378 domain-containing protein [Mesorhizobium sp.]TIX28944.1 MAG: hypothetical protein E5V35_00870 [Mesorhizobium sp.]
MKFGECRITVRKPSLVVQTAKAFCKMRIAAIRNQTYPENSHSDTSSVLAWLERVVGLQAFGAFAVCTTTKKEVQRMRATDIAAKAADLVGGDREQQHGKKVDNFGRIATVWNAWLAVRRDPSAPLDAHDVGILMVLMKAARTQSGSHNMDDYVDMAGYAACSGEVAQAAV